MKVEILALEIYQNGVLTEVRVLGDTDDYDKETCVTYYDTTDLNEVNGVFKGSGSFYLGDYLKQAATTGQVRLQTTAEYLPKKLGSTEVKLETKTFDW